MRKYLYHYNRKNVLFNSVNTIWLSIVLFILPIVLGALLLFIDAGFSFFSFTIPTLHVSWQTIFYATLLTSARISCAYVVSLFLGLVLAFWVTHSKSRERIWLPIFDVLESIPVLAFFPLVITFFIAFGFINGAAIFLLIIGMLWNIVFTVVGGIKLIPSDILDVAHIYKIEKMDYVLKILIPSVTPEIITGSILSIAAGWDIVIVAEVLHVYMAKGNESSDLLGLGSLLVHSSTENNTPLFIITLTIMTFIIAFTNIFIWQKLLRYSEKFRFE